MSGGVTSMQDPCVLLRNNYDVFAKPLQILTDFWAEPIETDDHLSRVITHVAAKAIFLATAVFTLSTTALWAAIGKTIAHIKGTTDFKRLEELLLYPSKLEVETSCSQNQLFQIREMVRKNINPLEFNGIMVKIETTSDGYTGSEDMYLYSPADTMHQFVADLDQYLCGYQKDRLPGEELSNASSKVTVMGAKTDRTFVILRMDSRAEGLQSKTTVQKRSVGFSKEQLFQIDPFMEKMYQESSHTFVEPKPEPEPEAMI